LVAVPTVDEVLRGVADAGPKQLDVVAFTRQILGLDLYPVQQTILRLIFLDVEHMTAFDNTTIDRWTASWSGGHPNQGVVPDVWDRVNVLRAKGDRHFREVLLLIGRRGGKSYLGAVATAYQIYTLITWGHPQRVLGIDPDKDLVAFVAATNKDQSEDNAFKDVATLIKRSEWFKPWIAASTSDELLVLTPHDLERVRASGEATAQVASIHVRAISSSAPSSRGPAGFLALFDEFSHMAATPSGARSGDELWHAVIPSLDQTKEHALVLITTTPASQVGQAYQVYLQAQEMDSEGAAVHPQILTLQIPSWEPYLSHDDPVATEGRVLPPPPESLEGRLGELLQKERHRNPQRFATEREAQWQGTLDAFLDLRHVERIFQPYCPLCGHSFEPAEWTENRGSCLWCGDVVTPVAPQFHREHVLGFCYMGHADPAERHDNFAVCIGHLQTFTEPAGEKAHHVVIDVLKIWKPEDHGGELPYLEIQADLAIYVSRFPFMRGFTYDQFGAMGTINDLKARLREKKVKVRVFKFSHTAPNNKEREEIVKEALAMNLIHSPVDADGPRQTSLLAEEMKRLQLVNGRVVKPSTGEVRTDDAWTAFSVVAYRLLTHQYGRHIREALAQLPLLSGAPGGYHTSSVVIEAPAPASEQRSRLEQIGRRTASPRGWAQSLYDQQSQGRGLKRSWPPVPWIRPTSAASPQAPSNRGLRP
jgi:hypothetical protein